jgi:hypothetical protein
MQTVHAIETLSREDGHFIKFFLLDGSINLNKWGVTIDALTRNLKTFIGTPFVITEDFGHPKAPSGDALMTIQEAYRKGDIIDVGFEEKTGKAWAIAEIKDKQTQELIKSGKIKFVSPAIVFNDLALRKQADGSEQVIEFKGAHVAGVKDPAFGVLKAQIKGQCNGGSHECKRQLMMVQACAGCGTFHKEDVKQAQDDACVSKWISELSNAHPDWDKDQVTAVAFAKCKEGREGNLEKGYECPKCGAKFATEDEMKGHMSSKHAYASIDEKWIISATTNNDLVLQFNTGSEITTIGTLTNCGNLRVDTAYMQKFKQFNAMTEPQVQTQTQVKVEDVAKLQDDVKGLTAKVESLEKEKTDLINKLDAERKKPIVDKIVSAKVALGKVKEEERQAEFDKLIKKDQSYLEEISTEYSAIQEAKKTEEGKKLPYTTKYSYASTIDPSKGDQVLMTLRGR